MPMSLTSIARREMQHVDGLIDHGATLYFHHAWTDIDQRSKDSFPLIKEHILLLALARSKQPIGQ